MFSTHVRGIIWIASDRHGKVMGSMLGYGKPSSWCTALYIDARSRPQWFDALPNFVIAKDVKSCTYCCYVKSATVQIGGNALVQNSRKLWQCTVRTSRERSCNQRTGCLLWSKARIYDLWDGCLDKRKVRGQVPCCGQDGYRAQVPQHPLDSYRYIIYKTVCFQTK